jgi:molybdenum cofactor synthesis domain-containing protein
LKSESTASTERLEPWLEGVRFSVATLSDRASRGEYQDQSGAVLRELGRGRSGSEAQYRVIPDEPEALREVVLEAVDARVDVLFLSGGTGISKRDITPETVKQMSVKELVGVGELQRQYGSKFTPAAWLSRASAYVVEGGLLVVCFPGSPKAVEQGFQCIGPLIRHALQMIVGGKHESRERG